MWMLGSTAVVVGALGAVVTAADAGHGSVDVSWARVRKGTEIRLKNAKRAIIGPRGNIVGRKVGIVRSGYGE